MAGAEVGPNDIIIHLVNPYKCSDCGSEFFLKNVFVEHLAEHIDKMKAQNPCYQILCGVSLAAPQANSVTVTRDILQINENQMFELQDTSVDYTQLTPLKILEQAGILNLPPPQKMSGNSIAKMDSECHETGDIKTPRSTNTSALPQSLIQQDLAIIPNSVDHNIHGSVLKTLHAAQGNEISTVTNAQNLQSQGVNSSAFESLVQQSSIVNDGLKEELNVIIEAPAAALAGGHPQEEFAGIHDPSDEGLRGVRTWGEADIEAIMSGKHIVLVKKVLKPEYELSRSGRAVCKICLNEFANKNVLMRHQVVHSGIKPHCCFTCFKEFNDVSSLRKHMLIHKRSHRCPICLKMFLRRRQMELHLRQHNKKRFIQFGQKYHEVQVSTSRNEREQIVHEFSLSALLKKNGAERSETSDSGINNSFSVGNLNIEVNHGKDSKIGESETSGDQDKFGGENQDNLENTQNSYKKIIYRCGHCKKFIYTRPTLSRHLMLHTNEKPFMCEKCGKQFRHKSDLVHHYKTHLKPVKCLTCGSAFSKRLYLNKHLEKGCPFFEEENEKFTILPNFTYQCNLCNKNLKSKANVYRHMRVHAFEDRKIQESDTKKISKAVKDIHSLIEGKDMVDPESRNVEDFIKPLTNSVGFQCKICEEEFRFKSFVLIHVRMHLNQRPFKCKECGHGFYGRYLLRKHQQNHTRPYKCPICGKGFNRRYLMTHHFNKNHSEGSEDKMRDITFLPDSKLLCCDICGKTMKSYQKSLMQYHIRLHKDVRPHQCKICQKTFISDITLKKHMLNHSKPYVCQVCGRGFSRRYLMLEHYEKICGLKNHKMKTFFGQNNASSNASLNESISVSDEANVSAGDEMNASSPYEAETVTEFDEQSGTEIFKCVPCDKAFTVNAALMRHIKTFMKQTPCKYCKTVFADKHLTLAHQRSCLGVNVKNVSQVKKTNVVTHSQEKVFKVMKELNEKIENYSSDAPSKSEENSSRKKRRSSKLDLNTEAENTESVSDDDHKYTNQDDSKSSSLKAKKSRTISALNEKSKYPCPECDKAFATTRGLKIHATCHVRLFQCETCGQDFTQIKAFRNHLKTHTEEVDDTETDQAERVSEEDKTKDRGTAQEEPRPADHQEKDCAKGDNSNTITKTLSENCGNKHEDPHETPVKKSKVSKSTTNARKSVGSSESKGVETVIKQREQMDVSTRLMQTGTRGRPYSCKLCRKRFTEEAGLNTHVSQAHASNKSNS